MLIGSYHLTHLGAVLSLLAIGPFAGDAGVPCLGGPRHRGDALVGEGGTMFLIAGLMHGAVIPFTLVAIFPTNRKLQAEIVNPAADATRVLLVAWGRLHAGRTGLSLAALALMLVQGLWYWGM